MAKRKFLVELTCEVEIDDAVIASVDDEWRSRFYPLTTPEKIAEHVAFNLIVNNAELSQLDGFADKSDEMASVVRDTIDIEVEEIT